MRRWSDLDVIQHGARRVEGDAPLGGGPAADEPDAERPRPPPPLLLLLPRRRLLRLPGLPLPRGRHRHRRAGRRRGREEP
jgi:hypothetical protein